MMKVYLMQHGKPVAKEEDPQRPLSDRGKKDVQRMADFLRKSGVKVEEVLHSGKTRARQTAEIMASGLNPGLEPKQGRGLSPLDEVKGIADRIRGAKRDLLIAGHLPHLAKLTSLLIAGSESVPVVIFQQGATVCLEKVEGDRFSLAWMIVPELIK